MSIEMPLANYKDASLNRNSTISINLTVEPTKSPTNIRKDSVAQNQGENADKNALATSEQISGLAFEQQSLSQPKELAITSNQLHQEAIRIVTPHTEY
jgi:hypothetical protein